MSSDDDPIITRQVTYLPGPGDPQETTWGGHTFTANAPQTVQAQTSWFEHVRSNKFFRVGGVAKPPTPAAKAPAKPSAKPTAKPKQHKGHKR